MNTNQLIPRQEAHEKLDVLLRAGEAELIELHRDLVRLPTVNAGDGSPAREHLAADFMARWLGERGIAARCVEGAPGRSNLLAEHQAGPGGRSLLLMSHSDVVPPGDPAAWRHPPFSGELAEGRIWGRGANDCKMLVACELFAMAVLRRSGLLNSGLLRLAVGADEEAGGEWGFGWLAKSHGDFLTADLAINEGGGAYLGESASGDALFLVGAGEKGRAEVVFTATGTGAHASTPWGRLNPLTQLARIIRRIEAFDPPVVTFAPVFELLGRIERLDPDSGEDLKVLIEERSVRYSRAFQNSLKAQSRITLAPTVLHAGEKSNALPAHAELRCDARILPGQTFELIRRAVAEIAEGIEGVQVRIEITAEPSVSPFDAPMASLFEAALGHTFGRPCSTAPTWCTGFTDSRFVRPFGTPVYGFQVVHPGADADRLSIHCIDESIEVGMLAPCAQALAHLALDFCPGG